MKAIKCITESFNVDSIKQPSFVHYIYSWYCVLSLVASLWSRLSIYCIHFLICVYVQSIFTL